MDCLFCKIIKRELPCKIVFENENIFAFRDIDPKAPVHVLVVPKRHFGSLNDVLEQDSLLMGELQLVIKEIAKKENIDKSGYRAVLNSGHDAGQAVGHMHYHILGGRKLQWPPG